MPESPTPESPTPDPSISTCDAIARLVPGALLVRLVPHGGPHVHSMQVHFYDREFRLVLTDRPLRIAVARSVVALFPDADWRRGHDLYVPEHALYRSPDAAESGFVPEDDGTFGLLPGRHVATLRGHR